ncbi:methyltransferase, FxLD system [Plantactinospora sp. B6F1]|uniref:methyltransferase, FxLD system n=1 Tax=Plantactinospora sp. B6F1 TaxID=3158971 RepID=UPI0032D99857
MSIDDLRQSLIDTLDRLGVVDDPDIRQAFARVPRELFLPGVPAEVVFLNEAVPVKFGGARIMSSSSQPSMMAIMLGQLDVRPGHRVLEIGTGSGYNAALLDTLVGAEGRVVTIDIEPDLVAAAREHLARAGHRAVTVRCGDGALGYAEAAPYDRIIATAGVWDVYPALLDQLADGGRVLLPISVRGSQLSVAFERHGDHLRSVSVEQCGFMRLRGANAGPEHKIDIDPDRRVRLLVPDERPVDVGTVRRLLDAPPYDQPTGVSATLLDVHNGLDLWLSVHLANPVRLISAGSPEAVAAGPVPCMYEWKNPPWHERVTFAVTGGTDLAALARRPGEPLDLADPTVFELLVRAFGTPGAAHRHLLGAVHDWQAAGRPDVSGVSLRAYPAGERRRLAEGEFEVPKHHSVLALTWVPSAARSVAPAAPSGAGPG